MSNSSKTLRQLMEALANAGSYTAKTQEELQQTAESRAQADYEEKALAANQSYQTKDEALSRQLTALQAEYDARKAESGAAYQAAESQAGREQLARGMQRSSYDAAQRSGIRLAGAAAQQKLGSEQTAQSQNLESQRTQLASQLAETLRQYGSTRRTDVESYLSELTAQEEEKASSARKERTELLEKLLEYQTGAEQSATEQANWRAEFKAKYGYDPLMGKK